MAAQPLWERIQNVAPQVVAHSEAEPSKPLIALGIEGSANKCGVGVLRFDASSLAIAQDFAQDAALFGAEWRAGWRKLMNADRFDGPARNLCDRTSEDTVQLVEAA